MQGWPILLRPKTISWKTRFREPSRGARLKWFLLTGLAVGFWVLTFFVFQRVLLYFRSVEVFGDLLSSQLLGMILLTFFSVLLLSNLISSLSIFFLAEDLNLILCRPVSLRRVYYARLTETALYSSWMVLLFALPVFLAYGWVYEAPPAYYLVLLLTLVPFLIIPSGLGTTVAMILVNIFPARRTKDVLFILSILLVIGLYFLFRFLKPERLVNPDSFASMVEYMTALSAPSWPFLPSFWFSESLMPYLQRTPATPGFFIALLWSTAGAMVVIGSWVSGALFFEGWSKSQEARRARLSRKTVSVLFWKGVSRLLAPQRRALVLKDLRTFLRDSTQWSQLMLLLALVVVYLYNFSVLPLDQSPMPTFFLQNLISFLNMGLAGFVLSAVCGRFVFPTVSQEGFSFWIIGASPISLRLFLWNKFWTNLVPLLLLAQVLILLSNWLLKATLFMLILSSLTLFFVTPGIVGLAVGMGAIYPQFKSENPARMAWGFGGVFFMILSMLFISGVLILEAWPVYTLFMADFQGRFLSLLEWCGIFLSFSGVAVLIGLAVFLPMRLGLKRIMEMDF